MLPAFKTVEGGIGLQTYALDVRVKDFQPARDAGESSAGSQSSAEMRNGAARLAPNFQAGVCKVRTPIRGIAVLVGIKISFGIRVKKRLHAPDRAVRAFIGRREN